VRGDTPLSEAEERVLAALNDEWVTAADLAWGMGETVGRVRRALATLRARRLAVYEFRKQVSMWKRA
jgi:hypothetical protein